MFLSLSILAALLVTLTAFLLLVGEDWRIHVGLLAAQYMGVFMLVALEWPVAMAAIKLVAGWMAGAVLGMAMLSLPSQQDKLPSDPMSSPSIPKPVPPAPRKPAIGRVFFLLAALLVTMAVYSQVSQVSSLIPDIEPPQVWGGLILIGLGLLKLGFNLQPLPVALALLTVLSGFEVLYAALDATPLVAGLFGGVTLGLALAGAYLLVAPSMEEKEE